MSVLPFERQGDNKKLCINLDKFYILGGKSLAFIFSFSFPYHSSTYLWNYSMRSNVSEWGPATKWQCLERIRAP